jgi:hypothetical protein
VNTFPLLCWSDALKREFLKPELIGERFDGHGVSLQLQKDFAALQIADEHIAPVDPLDTTLRLEQIAQLKDGWLDGNGRVRSKEKLEWLKEALESKFSSGLPLPYLYPTAEGGIQAEWRVNEWFITLEVNPDTREGEYQALNVNSDATKDLELRLDQAQGWQQLTQALQETNRPLK